MTSFFKTIFNLRRPATEDVPTVPIRKDEPDEQSPDGLQEECSDIPQLVVGWAQSIGKQRHHNEDALFTLTTNLAGDNHFTPMGLYIVADGMGGHKHGEIASEIAVRTIGKTVVDEILCSLLSPEPASPEDSIQDIMRQSVEEAHRMILEHAPDGGTTLTSLLILDDQMTIAHIGDSRAYALSLDGESQILTRDHTLVMRMLEVGQLTAEEAAVHPQRNVLYRALGQGDQITPDIRTLPLPESGHILLCSDGLWGVISEQDIVSTVSQSPNPQIACQHLVDSANESGGPDNITAILVQLPG